jgi:hypothetical protein
MELGFPPKNSLRFFCCKNCPNLRLSTQHLSEQFFPPFKKYIPEFNQWAGDEAPQPYNLMQLFWFLSISIQKYVLHFMRYV